MLIARNVRAGWQADDAVRGGVTAVWSDVAEDASTGCRGRGLRVSVALTAEILEVEAAAEHAARWRDLAARALEPNPFFAPDLAIPGLRHLPEGRRGSVVMVWRGEERRDLVGVLPIVGIGARYLAPLPARQAAAFYGTISTPLLGAEAPDATLAAMLASLGQRGIHALHLPYLHEGGQVDAVLAKLEADAGVRRVRIDGFRRAFLQSALPGSDYMRATLETRRRKEADRQRRRLADIGSLTFRVARGPLEIAAAVELFLDLEALGWKGREGTDLKTAPGSAAFLRDAAAGLAAHDAIRIAILSLDERPIAAGLVLTAQNRAYYTKTCYAEDLGRFSPGFLLTLDLTAHLLDDPALASADSIAIADHPMIDRLWVERFPVMSILVETGPAFGLVAGAERLRETIRQRSRAFRTGIRAWRSSRNKG
ncbi:GNAT family N-acetyltransferase [Methylobacterium planeticum]|uniref:GNAT family N-acetyltransferase n=1 Tax=Methylobacterium planeticum TaxID=2615211 RepID=A0A6N6MU63_9HYPH|nr:GNAT family N-acetyltransferase [Methylobacterium planeticum]KAB1074055.1 GNAT family N-acetyltransferase [Methylobacterium planeticum]